MKKAVITGGNGFVGKILTDKLIENGYTVKIFSRSKPSAFADNPAVETVKVDYNNVENLAAELSDAEAVFHLAAAIFAFNKEEFWQANVTVTENLAQAVRQAGCIKSFVYLSSQAAAGPSAYKNNPKTEADAPNPVSDYGITKLKAEEVVLSLPQEVHKVILRAPVVYGRNDSGVSKIAGWVKKGFMVNTSSGEMFFNFVYVEDLVKALYTASVTPQADGQVFFVGEAQSYSWQHFINSMADAMGSPRPIMFTLPFFFLEVAAFLYESTAKIFGITPALNYDKIKEASITGHWVCNTNKWMALTGQSFTPLEQGLRESFK